MSARNDGVERRGRNEEESEAEVGFGVAPGKRRPKRRPLGALPLSHGNVPAAVVEKESAEDSRGAERSKRKWREKQKTPFQVSPSSAFTPWVDSGEEKNAEVQGEAQNASLAPPRLLLPLFKEALGDSEVYAQLRE